MSKGSEQILGWERCQKILELVKGVVKNTSMVIGEQGLSIVLQVAKKYRDLLTRNYGIVKTKLGYIPKIKQDCVNCVRETYHL